MKLTDEQREEIRGYCQTWLLPRTVERIELLFASEKAWREEAEESKQVTMEVSAALVESTMQLNQAKELLKEVYEREGWLKIKDFLSSLGEK